MAAQLTAAPKTTLKSSSWAPVPAEENFSLQLYGREALRRGRVWVLRAHSPPGSRNQTVFGNDTPRRLPA